MMWDHRPCKWSKLQKGLGAPTNAFSIKKNCLVAVLAASECVVDSGHDWGVWVNLVFLLCFDALIGILQKAKIISCTSKVFFSLNEVIPEGKLAP